MQQHRTAILVPGRIVLPLAAHEACDLSRRPEGYDDLVDQVGTEIVDRAAAGNGFGFPASARGERGSVAVEVGFEFGDAAEGVVFEEGEEGQEVGVPAAVCAKRFFSEGGRWGGWEGVLW